jgi:hypothetical protein
MLSSSTSRYQKRVSAFLPSHGEIGKSNTHATQEPDYHQVELVKVYMFN